MRYLFSISYGILIHPKSPYFLSLSYHILLNFYYQFARHRLLRCYLDQAEAGEARALLDQYPNEPYCCFAYSRALIECIALLLEETDASVDLIDAALTKGALDQSISY